MLPHIFVSKEYPLHVFENLISANKFSIVNFFFFLFVVFVVVVLFSAYIEPITQPYFFLSFIFHLLSVFLSSPSSPHFVRAPVGILRVSTAAAITVFPFVAWLYYHINKDLRSDWPSHCTTAI